MHANQISQLAREIAEKAIERAGTPFTGVVDDLELSDSDQAALRAELAQIGEEVARGPSTPTQPGMPRLLGPADEPEQAGAVVAVHYGDYRRQELWVASGANVGNWYPLGGEFWVTWDRQRMPAGVTKDHPVWADVLARGPVILLVPAGDEAYRQGWANGRRDLWQAMEDVAGEDPQ